MSNENVIENGAAETCHVSRGDAQNEKIESGRPHVGKIGRLPGELREEINTRIYDGKTGPEILAWLNELPVVKEILAAKFAGAPINEENLSSWRRNGYQCWLADKKVNSMQNSGEYATRMADAAGGSISRGVAALASQKILQFLETPAEKTPESLVKLANVSARLCRTEQGAVRLKISQERLRQQEGHLLLMRDKHQRDTIAILLDYLADDRAKEIEASDCDYAEKIELLGQYIYDDIWEPRPFPLPPSDSSAIASASAEALAKEGTPPEEIKPSQG